MDESAARVRGELREAKATIYEMERTFALCRLGLGTEHELAGVGDHDGRPRAILLVRRHLCDSLNDVIAADDASEDDVFT